MRKWITVGIPFSFVGSLLFFGPASLTLNLATLIGFFLMVGLVVDDALVVGESIAAERDNGKRGAEAAAAGARAVVGPITIGACTTLLAFVPFLFVTATVTQLVNVFPYVALFVLSVSLIEAFFILPAHLSNEGRWSREPLRTVQARVCDWIDLITPIQARRRADRELVPELLAKYPGLSVEREGGARDERAMLETLGLLVPVVLIAMYALMAAFLRSYWKPLVAVAGFPIAFAGAVLAHWVLGWNLGALSLLGLIAVFGVVVNDALVLLDRYNVIRRENDMLPAIAAAAAAARHRFRAVFLTTATTILGLSPMLYERSDDLIFLVPFVVSMVGGLVLSGAFILFILPTLVMMAEGASE